MSDPDPRTTPDRVRGARWENVASARELRQRQTPAERVLWSALRGRQLGGLKFRRQYALGAYILDFCCPERRVIVELDGRHHGDREQAEYDAGRTEWLTQYGYRVLRFPNDDVLQRLDNVLMAILEGAAAAEDDPPPKPTERTTPA